MPSYAPPTMSNSTTSSFAEGKTISPEKALRKYYQHEYPLIGLWVIAGIACVFALFNIHRLISHHRRIRKIAPTLSSSSEKDEFSSPPLPAPSAVSRAAETIRQTYNRSFGWREFSVSLWWNVSWTETTWSALYCMMVMVLGFLHMPVTNATRAKQATMIANRCGLIAFAQMPFIVGLAGKNNILSWLTGISYERLNFLHRSAARACLVLSWVHSLGRAVPIGLKGDTSLKNTDIRMGVVALAAYTIMTFISVKPFLRKFAYEVFLISHILLVLIFLISAYFHWPEYGYFIWPSFVVWGFDRIVRVLRVFFLNRLWLSFASKKNEFAVATVETLHGNALKVTLNRPYNWTPGQHAYLVCPGISILPFEAHPFTISSIPLAQTSSNPLAPTVSPMVFLVKVLDGFTARLALKAAESNGKCEIKAYVDGPYGVVHSQEAYDNVVLVAGGSGVTYTLPILSGLVESAKAGKSAVRSITFVVVMQNHEHTSWISPQLSSLLQSCPSHLHIDIRFYITRPILHVLSSSGNGNGDTADSSPRLSIEAGSSQDHSDTFNEVDEKNAMGRKDLGFGTVEEGRPKFDVLLGEVIKSSPGGKTSISVCGPGSLSSSVRSALVKSSAKGGAYELKDVREGRVGSVNLHVESFGW